MELSGENLLHYKQKLIDCLRTFDEFCSSHNLKYFAAYGTALGAIRHHGFIPWDDDIDVFMPRKDYEKLLSLKDEIKKDYYYVYDPSDEGYYKQFAKMVDMKTSLWELKEIPFMIGVFIDIFPLDFSPLEFRQAILLKKKHTSYYWNLKRAEDNHTWKDVFNSIFKKSGVKLFIRELYSMIWLKNKRCLLKKKFDALDKLIRQYPDNNLVTSYWGVYKEKEVMPKIWFEGFVEVPFENYKIRVPINYEAYLTNIYGDYMKMPPKEKQKTHHKHYYYNLDKRMSIEEAVKYLNLNKNK